MLEFDPELLEKIVRIEHDRLPAETRDLVVPIVHGVQIDLPFHVVKFGLNAEFAPPHKLHRLGKRAVDALVLKMTSNLGNPAPPGNPASARNVRASSRIGRELRPDDVVAQSVGRECISRSLAAPRHCPDD